MFGPVGVDVSPAGKVIFLDHVDQTREVLNSSISVVRGGRLHAGLRNPLGLSSELDIANDIGVEDVALAVSGVADGNTDVVVENGETCACE